MADREKLLGSKDVASETQIKFEKAVMSKDKRLRKKEEEPKNAKLSNLDTNKERNMGITLSYMRMPVDEIMEAIEEMDSEKFNIDALEGLLSIVPTKQEMESARKYADAELAKGNNKPPSQPFEWTLKCFERPLISERLQCWLLHQRFDINADQVSNELTALKKAGECILKDTRFQFFLAMTLTIGNIMNQGSRYCDAIGFRVWGENGGLSKVSQVKDNDGKGTLLTFVLKWCLEKDPDFENIFPLEETELYKNSAVLNMSEIMIFITDLAKSLKMLKAVLEEKRLVRGVFHSTLEPFHKQAVHRIQALTELKKQTEETILEVFSFFGETEASMGPQELFQQLHNFAHVVRKSVKDVIAEKPRRRREKMKAPTFGGTMPGSDGGSPAKPTGSPASVMPKRSTTDRGYGSGGTGSPATPGSAPRSTAKPLPSTRR
eukprot:TRINITY_DN22601_c0_g3_i1.p2 TRINITY_DN22601_c0_g3~~TRINITY_DN22601_c0_g3_i1.p2  ORF type:complete len:485 (+),score=218.21 TRINITY_DN22601_c0_g3_i1:155-1456(+)